MPLFDGNVLKRIITNSEDYCCLCYQSFEDKEIMYDVEDEVALDTERFKALHEILATVLDSRLIFDALPTRNICQKCTESAVNSLKFIEKCKYNIQKLWCTIECLQKYTKSTIKSDPHNLNAIFLAMDIGNYTCNYFYETNHDQKNNVSINRRWSKLKSKICNSNRKLKEMQRNSFYHSFLEDQTAPDHKRTVECLPNTYEKKEIIQNISLRHVRKTKKTYQFQDLSNIPHEKVDDINYKCTQCSKVYHSAVKLKQHYLRVHAPKDFKCSECSRSFGSSLLLNRHTKDSHHTVVCSQCGKIFNNTHSFRHHVSTHKSSLVCHTCGKVYKGKQSLKNHIELKLCGKMRKSNADAKFTCDYCGTKYSQKTALSVHIRLKHENGKGVICDWCGKKLCSESKLKEHMIKHTKQKNFECNICGGKFVTKTSLLYHTRLHTGEKPYKCTMCEISFVSASRRSEHVKQQHHGIDNFECDICHCKFKGPTHLKSHRKRHFNTSSRLYCKLNTDMTQ